MRCFGCEKEAETGMVTLQTPNGEFHLCGARRGEHPKRACLIAVLEELYSVNRCPICHTYASASKGFHAVCPACQESIDTGKRAIESQQASNESQAEAFLADALELAKDLSWYEPSRTMRTAQIKQIFAKSAFFRFAQKYIEKLVNDAFLRGLRFGSRAVEQAIAEAEKEVKFSEQRVDVFASDIKLPKRG